MGESLDPRWEWIETYSIGHAAPTYLRGHCRHVASTGLFGPRLQHFCQPHTCPQTLFGSGTFAFQGVTMLLLDDKTEAVTAAEAARMLDKQPSTIRCWATRYGARQLGKLGKVVYYDFLDLAVIERELSHGCKVPPTVEERAAIRSRCPLAVAA